MKRENKNEVHHQWSWHFSSVVISDTSIKNYVATSISHIHLHDKPIIKMIHQAVNIITTEAKLFAIRCNIN